MQPNNSRDALSQLQTFQSSRRKPQDVLRESEERLGIPTATQRQVGLRGAITNTENLLKNVDPSVSGRTQGSLVTDAQKQRLIALEREPIAGQFTEQSRALENETANVADLNRRALQESQLSISADDARQNELQGLYQSLYQREQDDLARQERERAFQLQQEEARRAAAGASAQQRYLEQLFGQQTAQQRPATAQASRPSLESILGKPKQAQKGKPTQTKFDASALLPLVNPAFSVVPAYNAVKNNINKVPGAIGGAASFLRKNFGF